MRVHPHGLFVSIVVPAAAVACVAGSAPRAGAVIVGVPDTFTNGSVSEWYGGTTITNVSNGQNGLADNYITVQTVSGSSSGSHLATHNADPRWSGDYIGGGVTSISVDMRNLSSATLQMRVVLFGGGTRWTSTTPISLAPNSGWQHLSFPVSQATLSRVLGAGTYQDSLSAVTQIMFRHATGLTSGGTAVSATLGIDNVMAVPGPGAAGMIGLGGLWAMRRRR